MFQHAIDLETGTLLGIFSGTHHGDNDYECSLVASMQADSVAAERGVPYVYVCVDESHSHLPPPLWRRRFADASKKLRSQEMVFVLVTSSALLRGAFLAYQWLAGSRPGYDHFTVASFSDACELLEQRVQGARPRLKQLQQRIADRKVT